MAKTVVTTTNRNRSAMWDEQTAQVAEGMQSVADFIATRFTRDQQLMLITVLIERYVGSERHWKRPNFRAAYDVFDFTLRTLLYLCPPTCLARVHEYMHMSIRRWAELALQAETARRAGKRPRDHRNVTFAQQLGSELAPPKSKRATKPPDGVS